LPKNAKLKHFQIVHTHEFVHFRLTASVVNINQLRKLKNYNYRKMSKSVLQPFDQYQKARVQFVQTVAELATRPQNIEALHKAGKER
jgi:hypothetical protein